MLKIYHNPRCAKSREGLAILETSGQDFEVVEYLKDIPSKEQLREILNYLDIPALQLVRKNEAVWKEKFKGKTLSEDEIIQAMTQYPKLIERPIVIRGTQAVVGRPPETIKDLL